MAPVVTSRLRRTAIAIGLLFSGSAAAEGLSEIFQHALQNNPQLRAAESQRDATSEGVNVAYSALLPQLSAQGNSGYLNNNKRSNDTNWSNDASVSLSQQIYAPKTRINLNKSEKAALKSEIQYRSERQQLILNTASAYFNILNAQDNLVFVQARLEAFSKQLEESKQRYAVGLIAITDVEDSQSRYDQAVTDEIVAQNTLDNSYESLREITGNYYQQLDQLDTSVFETRAPLPATADEWVGLAEENNLSLQDSLYSQAMAEDDLDLARADRLPTVSLRASYSTQDSGSSFGDGFDMFDNNTSQIGVQVNVPVYTGGRISASVRQASSLYSASSQVLEATHRNVVREVRASYNTFLASASTIKAAEQAVRSAESALEAQQAGYEVGTRTIVEVLNATQALSDAYSRLSLARYTYLTNELRLRLAAGVITEQDLKNIDQVLTSAPVDPLQQ